ncbi:MAG: nickel pincer cofactor biosynthesis protein LarB, partial [Longimicrobiales bacterium]
MTREALLRMLGEVAAGHATPEAAADRLAWLPVETVSGADGDRDAVPFARLDHHRLLRAGVPEAVYCPGKTVNQVVEICRRFEARGAGFLATRAEPAVRAALREALPAAVENALGRTVTL